MARRRASGWQRREQRNFYRRVIVRAADHRSNDATMIARHTPELEKRPRRIAICNTNGIPVPNIILLVSGLVIFVCALIVIGRGIIRFSPARAREDLTISRGWLLEHQGEELQ